ncbi:MAG: hypothetical protein ACRD04_07785 [Terriglobales bacterium]
MKPTLVLAALLALPLAAQQATPSSHGTQIVVTALGNDHQPAAPIAASQVQLHLNGHADPIAQWAPYGPNQRIDLTVAIDDDTQHLGTGIDDIKTFIRNLPANVAVGVVYLHTGSFEVASGVTLNHAAAASKVRMPSGMRDSSPSPFGSLRDLLRHWPQQPGVRRELVMLSDGREETGVNDQSNHTFQSALATALAGGVVVYTIYASGGTDYAQGQLSNNSLVPDAAQALGQPRGTTIASGTPLSVFRNSNLDAANGSQNLSLLASETGGEGYANGISNSSRLTQYFNDINRRLTSQYRLVFTPNRAKDHGMTKVEVKVSHSHAHITAPKAVFLTPKS